MKSEKKVMITSALTLLQERDPDWKRPAMIKKFKTVYDGWRQAELRAKQQPQADFVRFRNYVMQ